MQPRQCLMFMLGLLLKMCQEHQMREGYEANNFGDNIFWNVCKVCMCYQTIGICHPLEDTTIVTSSNEWKMLCFTLSLCNGQQCGRLTFSYELFPAGKQQRFRVCQLFCKHYKRYHTNRKHCVQWV